MEFFIDFLNFLGDKIEIVLMGFVYFVGIKIFIDYIGKFIIFFEIDMMIFYKWDR